MSTRATYQINDKIFYIHHDGYVEGAAAYLFNMCQASPVIDKTGEGYSVLDRGQTRGGLEFAFIRGNGNCEPTDSHEAHADTEYRYVVTSGKGLSYMDTQPMLKAYARVNFSDDWKTIYDGTLVDFVNKYVSNPAYNSITGDSMGVFFTKIDNGSGETLLCTIEQALDAERAFNKKAFSYDEGNCNRQSNFNRALAINEALKNLNHLKNPSEAA